MKTSLFDYRLPKDRIAARSVRPRDTSRLLVLDRADGTMAETRFRDIGRFLRPGDLLVVNETKVFRARLLGTLPTGGAVELLLLRHVSSGRTDCAWEALGKPGKKLRPGTVVTGRGWQARIRTNAGEGVVTVAFPMSVRAVHRMLAREGHTPVPPYVPREPARDADYQTVYARRVGSVAAPTAGFHFTPRLVARLKRQGIRFAPLTLHVGIGTFKPVVADDLSGHRMHAEYAEIPAATVRAIRGTKRRGGRVVVVGTTTMRALEGLIGGQVEWSSGSHVDRSTRPPTTDYRPVRRAGWVDIFITPGYRFRVADALVTNFHLPRSTLLVLVSAFAGREPTLRAYRHAVREKFRFYSFGDAMLIM